MFLFLLGSVECIFSESPGTHCCFGAVGQSLIFHLSYKTDTSIVIVKDNKHRVLKTDNHETVFLDHEYVNQPNGINNGTLKLVKAMKKHSGYYQLEEHDSNGKLLKKANLCLKIHGRFLFYSFVCFKLKLIIIINLHEWLCFIKR